MENSKNSTGVSFISLLGLTFIILKLTDVIDWSWWWVLSPFLIGPAIVLVVLVLLIIFSKKVKVNKIFKFKRNE